MEVHVAADVVVVVVVAVAVVAVAVVSLAIVPPPRPLVDPMALLNLGY